MNLISSPPHSILPKDIVKSLFSFEMGRFNHWLHWLQWLCVAVVGISLGLYVNFFDRLPTDKAVLGLVAVISLSGIIMMRQVRKPLLIALLIDIPVPIDQYFALRYNPIDGGILGYNVSITTICLIGLYVLWLAELLSSRFDWSIRSASSLSTFKAAWPLTLFLVVVSLSIFVAADKEMAFFSLFLRAQLFLLFIYIVGTVNTYDDLMFIMTWLLIGATFYGLIMLGLLAYGSSFEFGSFIDARFDKGGRVGGTIGGPNSASGYLELLIVPSLSLVLLPLVRWLKLLAFGSFSLALIGILLTQSRGGWVAVSLSLLIFFAMAYYRGWIPFTVLFCLSLVVVGVGFFSYDLLFTRLTGGDNGAVEGRLPLLWVAFNMIQRHPFLGIGPNNFTIVLLQYAQLDNAFIWLNVVHNKYLLVWTESGTFGLVAFLGFLLTTLSRGWRAWLSQNPYIAPLALGITAAIIGQMAHMMFDIFQGRSLVQLLWILSALIVVLYRLSHPLAPSHLQRGNFLV